MYKYCTCKKCRMFRRDLEFNDIYETTSFNDKYRTYDIASSSASIQSNTVRAPFPVDKTLWEEAADKIFGTKEGKEMTQITVDINYGTNPMVLKDGQVFYIEEPKFKVGDKVKISYNTGGSPSYGKVVKVESNIHIFKSENSSKYQRDKNEWIYGIRYEKGYTTGVWNNIKEEQLSKDDRPEYHKYFDFLDKQGVKLDRDRYTWKSFRQEKYLAIGNIYVLASGVMNQQDINYYAMLCDKFTGKEMKFEGKQTGIELLPAISEKC